MLVLSCGHELFFGPADQAEQWFTDILGYPRPHDASAADYLLDVVNTDYSGDTKARQRLAISAMQGEGELQSAAACFRGSERFAQTIGYVYIYYVSILDQLDYILVRIDLHLLLLPHPCPRRSPHYTMIIHACTSSNAH